MPSPRRRTKMLEPSDCGSARQAAGTSASASVSRGSGAGRASTTTRVTRPPSDEPARALAGDDAPAERLEPARERPDDRGHRVAQEVREAEPLRVPHEVEVEEADGLGRRQPLDAVERGLAERLEHGLDHRAVDAPVDGEAREVDAVVAVEGALAVELHELGEPFAVLAEVAELERVRLAHHRQHVEREEARGASEGLGGAIGEQHRIARRRRQVAADRRRRRGARAGCSTARRSRGSRARPGTPRRARAPARRSACRRAAPRAPRG